MIDQYALNMRQEIQRLGLESDPDISGWISLYPNLPSGQSSQFAVSGKIFAPARQQYYNVRHAYQQFFVNTFFDGANPADANDSRLGNPFGTAMAGVGLGKGWNSPAVQRFLKIAWSKHLLHYANAAPPPKEAAAPSSAAAPAPSAIAAAPVVPPRPPVARSAAAISAVGGRIEFTCAAACE